MANVNPPKKNQAWSYAIGLLDMAQAGRLKTTPTIAAGDFQIDKDGAGFNNPATLPAESPAGSGRVVFSFTATEMNCDIFTIRGRDQSAPPEWADYFLCVLTTA